ncbi:hypothetical protein [Pontibacter litorisediminis]|uniref:hypothetical protein n=1 Tax=Pontibacter litorisediminis TaxID=1846260 RepID=UPI0023ECF259|nr:hypothetical protein [Pontibacter litorisediminis]
MKKELRDANDEVFFRVEADKGNGWIRGCWYGTASVEQAKSVGLLYVECLQRTPYSKILNDTRYYTGPFLDINEWLERVFIPPAVQAGLSCFVDLVPQGQPNRLAAEDFRRRVQGSFKAHIYDNEEEAMEWLRNCR